MKRILVVAMALILMAGVVGGSLACTQAGDSAEVKDAGDALDAALTYLREHEAQDAPGAGIEWQAEDVTPQEQEGVGIKEFTCGEWTVTVSYPVVPPENALYQVVVSSINLGWHWKGTVEPVGSVTEVSAFKQMSKEESQAIAEEFLRSSPTFVFDGIEGTLRLTDTLTARCPYCWVFVFEFDSQHAGYGDRTGQVLAQVITSHRAVIGVEQADIASAVMDNKWDMTTQELIEDQQTTPEKALSVSELIENPVYDTAVTIQGEVTLLGELFCPCFVLVSAGETIQVWYGLMVEDDGTEMPPVSVEGIENGDWVVITGELKQAGQHTALNDFWATSIEKGEDQIVGGTPGSCGYVWDAERGGWHRPWVPDSFIPADDKPEWDEFIASPVVASDILVDGSYAGKEIEIVVGGSLTVTLESNPTTGFQWELAGISDEAVLELVDQEFVAPETALVGAGGKELWTFKTLNEGVSEISMEYRRPWEQDVQPAETFVLTVLVR